MVGAVLAAGVGRRRRRRGLAGAVVGWWVGSGGCL